MTTHQIIDKLRGLYVYYPVQARWFKAFNGPAVDGSEVTRVCGIDRQNLARYEALQSEGVDRTMSAAFRG